MQKTIIAFWVFSTLGIVGRRHLGRQLGQRVLDCLIAAVHLQCLRLHLWDGVVQQLFGHHEPITRLQSLEVLEHKSRVLIFCNELRNCLPGHTRYLVGRILLPAACLNPYLLLFCHVYIYIKVPNKFNGLFLLENIKYS